MEDKFFTADGAQELMLDSLSPEELEKVTGGTDLKDKMLKCENCGTNISFHDLRYERPYNNTILYYICSKCGHRGNLTK